MYDVSLKAKWDYENTIAFAVEKARNEARKEGLEVGLHAKAIEIARRLISQGLEPNAISIATGLTISEIKDLGHPEKQDEPAG